MTKTKAKNCIVIFASNHEIASKIYDYLYLEKAIPCHLIDENTNAMNINKKVEYWNSMSRATKSGSTSSSSATSNKPHSIFNDEILICTDKVINFVNIRNANCVIHFDFPQTKELFAKRLWYMKDNFKFHRKNEPQTNDNDKTAFDDIDDEFDLDRQNDELDHCRSYMLLTPKEYEYSQGLLNYLMRVGVNEKNLPEMLVKMAEEKKNSKEMFKIEKPLCPYVKSYGKCVSPLKNCDHRHFLHIKEDALREISSDKSNILCVPNEGFVKVNLRVF
jgi:hypothetical protein